MAMESIVSEQVRKGGGRGRVGPPASREYTAAVSEAGPPPSSRPPTSESRVSISGEARLRGRVGTPPALAADFKGRRQHKAEYVSIM